MPGWTTFLARFFFSLQAHTHPPCLLRHLLLLTAALSSLFYRPGRAKSMRQFELVVVTNYEFVLVKIKII